MYDDKQTHHRKRGPALPEDGIIAATRPVPAEKAMRDVRDVI
jgi:hypothetical protein